MRRHRVLVALPLVATGVAIVATVSAAAGDRLSEDLWLGIGGMIAFTTVGAMIEDRRPGQVVGRICLTIGVLLIVSGGRGRHRPTSDRSIPRGSMASEGRPMRDRWRPAALR